VRESSWVKLDIQTEKMNLGAVRLPPGFRFHPTDEELVVQYLRRKVYALPLPASIIPDLDVCKSDPWDLPGNNKHFSILHSYFLLAFIN